MTFIDGPMVLETVDGGIEGWNDIVTANMQKISAYIWKTLCYQEPIEDRDLAAPPGSPVLNSRYIIAASPTGAWSGHAGKIAHWKGSAWEIYSAAKGFLLLVKDENIYLYHNGTTWVRFETILDHGNLAGLSDDDHTQYALLAGRSGGQTLKGGTAASNDLTLESTSNGTKGNIVVKDTLKHEGTKVGFYNVTPVVRPSAYTITNHTDSRSLNESAPPTNAELANILGTLINDLKALGLLQ